MHQDSMRLAMKGLILALLLVSSCTASAVGPIETFQEVITGGNDEFTREERTEPANLMDVGRMIMTALQTLLLNQERAFDDRLKQLELYIDHTCSSAVTRKSVMNQFLDETEDPEVENEVSDMLQGFTDKLSLMSHSFIDELEQQFDDKITLAMKKIDSKLSEKLSLSKIDSMLDKDTSSSAQPLAIDDEVLSAISRVVQSQVSTLAAKSDIEKQTDRINTRFDKVNDLSNSITDSKILNYTLDIHDILHSFKPIYENFRQMTKNCNAREDQFSQMQKFEQLLQDIKKKVVENNDVVSDLFQNIEAAEEILNDRLISIEIATKVNQNADEQQSIPVETLHMLLNQYEIPTPSIECKNSDVTSRLDIDLCSSVVRLEKCYLKTFAFHCCRSCTDAGQLQLPSMNAQQDTILGSFTSLEMEA